MQAEILIGVELSLPVEHADLESFMGHDAPVALGDVRDLADQQLRHFCLVPSPQIAESPRSPASRPPQGALSRGRNAAQYRRRMPARGRQVVSFASKCARSVRTFETIGVQLATPHERSFTYFFRPAGLVIDLAARTNLRRRWWDGTSMSLDVNTLFLVAIYVEALLGLLLLFAWVQNIADSGGGVVGMRPSDAVGLDRAVRDVWLGLRSRSRSISPMPSCSSPSASPGRARGCSTTGRRCRHIFWSGRSCGSSRAMFRPSRSIWICGCCSLAASSRPTLG